jgi:hypothetical protein
MLSGGITNNGSSDEYDELEKKYDRQFKIVFTAIRSLMTPPPFVPSTKPIGFRPKALKK